MPTILTEDTITGNLVFEFDDRWTVCKYDELVFYKRLNNTGIKGTGFKGVDFLAISKKIILLMELKYVIASNENSFFRLTETIQENDARPYLADEIEKKVRDTLLGLFAAYRNDNAELIKYSRPLFCNPDKPIVVFVFLERKGELNQPQYFKLLASSLSLAIEQKLNFFGNIKVGILNSLTLPNELGIKILENEIKS
jgi:hypothetical protein